MVFAEVFGIEPAAVTETSCPDTVDRWDSFGHMRLVMSVEERFGVTLGMDQVLEIDSYGALCRLLAGVAEAQ
jgi:acyl carrier protein